MIDLKAVDSITIKRYQATNHTMIHRPIKLTDSQAKIIIDTWKNAKATGLRKYLPVFEMIVFLTGNQTRNFRINANNIKEDKDWCYDLGDSDFIEKLLKRVD